MSLVGIGIITMIYLINMQLMFEFGISFPFARLIEHLDNELLPILCQEHHHENPTIIASMPNANINIITRSITNILHIIHTD